jgi:hypothetical protein
VPPDITYDDSMILTLEAFADTILPGEKRSPDDVAIAGAAPGPGAVAAGALDLLAWSATGITQALPDLVKSLNAHAAAYANQAGLTLDASLPEFTALAFEHRTALVRSLTTPGHEEKALWVLLALFSYMAFDAAAHLPTAQAVTDGHPGLALLGVSRPDADGLWRFADNSYRRQLADLHPATTPSGSPA